MIRYRRDLYKLFPSVEDAVCAELGVAEGLFSRDMLQDWGIKLLYSVDLWECRPERKGDIASEQKWHNMNYKNACDLLRPFGGRSKILRGETSTMAQWVPDGSCDMVYIDADHSLTGVTKDIYAWWPKLKRGGVMAFHDFEMTEYGVKTAVNIFSEKFSPVLKITLLPEDAIKDAGAYIIKP